MISFDKSQTFGCLSPKHIFMGDGASAKIPELLAGWQIPDGDLLVVADKEVANLGLDRNMNEALAEAGYHVACFDDIVGEPTLETANALIDVARGGSFKAVIGIGGGSAMDLTKLAAAMATNSGQITDHLGLTSFEKAPLPLILVPTTAGTGSEATGLSVLSIEGMKGIVLSPQLEAQAAVLDAELTRSLPPSITAATGMDALSHALEGFMSTNANPYSDTQALTTMSIVARWLKIACQDGDNMEARRAMTYAAFTGGLTLNAGVVLGHSVAYTIANRVHLSHGVSCAMVLPYTMAYNLAAIPERLNNAAAVVLGDPGATGVDLVNWVANLVDELSLPKTLAEVGIADSDLEPMITECVERYPRPTNPAPIDAQRLQVFYETMVSGDIARAVEFYQRG